MPDQVALFFLPAKNHIKSGRTLAIETQCHVEAAGGCLWRRSVVEGPRRRIEFDG
jgi:hypothetical protein